MLSALGPIRKAGSRGGGCCPFKPDTKSGGGKGGGAVHLRPDTKSGGVLSI